MWPTQDGATVTGDLGQGIPARVETRDASAGLPAPGAVGAAAGLGVASPSTLCIASVLLLDCLPACPECVQALVTSWHPGMIQLDVHV